MADEDNAQKKKSRKPSKKLLYFLIILIVILAEGFVLCYDYSTNEDSLLQDLSENYPILNQVLKFIPTDLINSFTADSADSADKSVKTIGKNSIGTVTLEGPYGNANSSVKVAYILGQHPRESNAHDAIYDSLLNNSDYLQDPYIFAPVSNDTVAYEAANNVTQAINYVIYYEPASYSSPQYSTIPIEEGGIPAIVFEMRGNPDHSLETEANQFIHIVDKLNL